MQKGAKEEKEWGTWRAPKPELARANSRVGAPSWRANLAVGAPTLELARANCQVGAPTLTWLPKSWLHPKKPTYCIITTKQRNQKL